MRRDHLLCFKWKDTSDVLCLSTAHKITTPSVEAPCKDGVKTKSKPDAILDYITSTKLVLTELTK